MAEELTPAQEAENQAILDKVEQHKQDLQEEITGQSDAIPEGFNADGTEIEVEIPEKFADSSKEDILKAYLELEKKIGSQEPTQEEESTATEPPKEIEATPEEVVEEKVEGGLDKFNKEFAENGSLSDDSYEELGKLGFSKSDVDNYIKGQQALAEQYTNTIYNSVGGQESYTELVEWASSNIAPETITEYNEALTGGNVNKATQLLEYMNMKRGTTNEQPNRLKGNASNDLGGIKPFADKSEWMKATANPLYGKDAKVTNLIDKRYLASRAKGLI